MKATHAGKEENTAASNQDLLQEKGLLVPFVKKRIKAEIRSLIKAHRIKEQDASDIKQDIFLELVKCIDSFNPENAGFETFISAVIFKAARKAARDHWANRHDSCQHCRSLDEPENPSDHECEDLLGDVVSDDEVAMYLGKRERTKHEQCLLASEVQAFISKLSQRQKSVCKELMNGRSIKEIACMKKIPRGTFYRDVILPIRKAMKEVGLLNNLLPEKNYPTL